MVKHPRLKPYGLIAAGVVATIGLFVPQSSAQSGQSASAQGPFSFPKPATSGGPFTQTPGDFLSSEAATQPPTIEIVKVLLANGTQDYQCRDSATGPRWIFTGPRANLFDWGSGALVGTHYNLQGTSAAGTAADGPRWRLSADGSTIRGRVLTSAPGLKANDIPFLLLSSETEVRGEFGHTTHIQRRNLNGGIAPDASKCVTSTVGTVANVPYTATYVLAGQRAIDGAVYAGDVAFTAKGADGSTQSCTAGTAGGFGRTCLVTGADGRYGVVAATGFNVIDAKGTQRKAGVIERTKDFAEGTANITRAAVALASGGDYDTVAQQGKTPKP
jgi:Protein of unknown function (DUF3455)